MAAVIVAAGVVAQAEGDNGDNNQLTGLIKGKAMNIYVGNLSLDISEDELRREFAEFGRVISVIIMNDKYIGSGQTRAYGYIEMSSKSEAATAITNLNGKRLRDRTLQIVEALPLSDKNVRKIDHTNRNYNSSRARERKYQIN